MPREQMPSVVERRSQLGQQQKLLMLATLVRSRSAFMSARDKLQPQHFEEDDKVYAIFWATVLDIFEAIEDLPSEKTLLAELIKRVGESDDLSDEEMEQLDSMVRVSYTINKEDLSDRVALHYLKIFLEDRLAAEARDAFSAGEHVPKDLFRLLSNLRDTAGTLDALGCNEVEDLFPAEWTLKETNMHIVSTTLSFLDVFMNGGHCVGESYVLMGPFGSCKTTLMLQLVQSVASATLSAYRHKDTDKLGVAYMFNYEDGVEQLRVRALSCGALIHRQELEHFDEAKLSRRGHLKDYERRIFANMENAPGEYERYKSAKKRMNINCRLIDMSGQDPLHPSRGSGGIPEVYEIIKADQEALAAKGYNPYVAMIGLDYAKAMVRRYMGRRNMDMEKHLRHQLGAFVLAAKDELAVAFRAPIWINQQLSGAANANSPINPAKMTDASENKSFAENATFVFTVGKPTLEGLCILHCDKARRAPPMSNVILRVEGHVGRVVGTGGQYAVDEVTKKIILQKDQRRLRPTAEDAYATNSYPTQAASIRRQGRELRKAE